MSKAANNLVLLVFCKKEGHRWNADAEDTLRLIAQNILAGNY